MRTTLTIDDDALAVARVYADARGLTLGVAVSDLIRQGRAAAWPIVQAGDGGPWVFALPADVPPVSAATVAALRDDDA